MKLSEIVRRLSGFSTPFGGISWTPPSDSDHAIARRVVSFLENRRVLFSPTEVEVPEHCFQSVIEIRHYLTGELGNLDAKNPLALALRSMRAECRRFLDANAASARERLPIHQMRGYHEWIFLQSLGQLRGVFGVHVAEIAAQHKLDVEEPLSRILPVDPNEDARPDE